MFYKESFRKNVKITITNNAKIRNKKLQNDINKEAPKISALSSSKIEKYEYVTCDEILPSRQSRIIEWATFTYSPLGKALEKQIRLKTKEKNKSIYKQLSDTYQKSVASLFSKYF